MMRKSAWTVAAIVLTLGSAGVLVAQAGQNQPLRFSEPVVIPAAETRAILNTLKPTDQNIDRVVRTLATNGSAGNISVAAVAYHARPQSWKGTANMHNKITEVFYVTKGSATFAMGGQLDAPTPFDPKSEGVRRIGGPGHNGTAKGNKLITAVAGDTIVLPPNTPHDIVRVDQDFEMVVIRIDPERVLELSTP